MLNLIRRDVILQKKLLLTFIPFIGLFIMADSHPVLIFLVASIFIPFNAYAYDEKAEVNILLNSLPYTRKEIIASRYLGALIYMVLAVGLTSIALFAFNKTFSINDMAIGGGLFLLFAAFAFPLFYILKPGYITTIVIISFITLSAIAPPIVLYLAEHLPAITEFIVRLPIQTLYLGAALIIITLYAASWAAATFIYQRKAF